MTTITNTSWQTNPLLKTTTTPMPAPRLDATQYTNPVPPGAFQYDSGGLASMAPPTMPTATAPAPTGTTATAPAPTGTAPTGNASTLQSIQSEAMRIQDILNGMASPQEATVSKALNAPTPTPYGDSSVEAYLRNLATTNVDEDKIRRDQLRMFQGQIDATNQIYDQMLGTAQTQGRDRMGSTVATGARSGVLGSDFGQAQQEKTQTFNNQIERGVQAERAAKVAEILGFARKSATDEIAAKNQARMQGAESYLDYLKNAGARKQENMGMLIQSMIEQGISPDEIDAPELKKLLSQYGTDENTIRFMYNGAKKEQDAMQAQAEQKARENELKGAKTEAEIRKIDADIARGAIITLGEGTMMLNTETGETFKNPKTYAPKSPSGVRIGSGFLNQEQVADVHTTLQENRGQDGYTDTGIYMREFDGFVRSGGDPKDFVKEYNPDIYINPNDSTRSFLQSQMKKPASDNFFLGSLGGIDINSAINEAAQGQ